MRGLATPAFGHAGFTAALHDLTGEDLAGTLLAVANRAERRVHRTMGWLSDNVVVQTRYAGDTRDPAFLTEFRTGMSAALDHCELPLAAVLARMAPELVGRPAPYPWAGFNSVSAASAHSARFRHPMPADLTLTEVDTPGGWHYKGIVVSATEDARGLAIDVSVKSRFFGPSVAETLSVRIEEIVRAWVTVK
jgi:hypothetical protein